ASTVAVVVPSPATSDVLDATSRTICAPMFSNLSSSSISLATVTPSLVTVGEPKLFSMTTLRPLGPSVTFTAFARALTPARILLRADSSYAISFAAISQLLLNSLKSDLLLDNAEDVVLAQDQMLNSVELHFGAGIFAKKHSVARLHRRFDALAVFHLAGADSDDFALDGLFFGGIGDDAPAFGFLFFSNTLDDYAVLQGTNLASH